MKKRYVYKLVRPTAFGNVFTSYVITGRRFCLCYRLGKVTVAPRGTLGIFVFKRLRDALDRSNVRSINHRPFTLLRCELTGSLKRIKMMGAFHRPEYFLDKTAHFIRLTADVYGASTIRPVSTIEVVEA